jgi:hypothetical protein
MFAIMFCACAVAACTAMPETKTTSDLAQAKSTTFVRNIQAAIPSWQSAEVVLAPGETAEISAEGQWGVIDPPHRGKTGPGGNGVRAGNTFMLPGAPEGCLLVKDGAGNVTPYPMDGSTLKIHVPGGLSFIANDDPNPPPGLGYNGFHDNIGSLSVSITVFR